MSTIDDRAFAIQRRLGELADEYNRKLAVLERINQQYFEAGLDLAYAADEGVQQKRAQAILLELEAAWRKDFEASVEQVVTEAIQLVFGTKDYFRILTKVERGASAIEFELETPDGIVQSILEAEGGSVGQLVSFMLRVLLILAHKPALRKVIILDEPFTGAMSSKTMPALQTLLRKIVEETGIQLIIATNDESFVDIADVAYEVIKTDGVARVERL